MASDNKAIDRKTFLKKSLAIGVGVSAGISLQTCSLFDEAEMLVGQISKLQSLPYHITKFNRKKIFVSIQEGKWVIFSMICRHKKCTVAWEAEEALFVCPCHDGMYDLSGQVVEGPPPAPLHRFKYEIRGEELWVLNEFA